MLKMAYGFLIRKFARQIVEDVYQGILSRSPDFAGREGYMKALQRNPDLQRICSELTLSDEAWRRQIIRHQSEIVEAVFANLLGRRPDEESAEHYRNFFEAGGSLSSFLATIVHSEEHRSLIIGDSIERARLEVLQTFPTREELHAQFRDVVRSTFRAVLLRDAEESAVEAYAATLLQNRNVAGFIDEVAASAEHQGLLERIDDLDKKHERYAQLVSETYRGLFGVDIQPEALASRVQHLLETDDVAGLMRELAAELREQLTATAYEQGRQEALTTMPSLEVRRERVLDVVRSTFQTLLLREPEESALQAYGEVLLQTGDIAAFIREVAASQEHLAIANRDASPEKQRERYVALIEACYQALLGRAVDPEALQSALAHLLETGDVTGFIRGIGASREHRVHVLFENK